MFAGTLHVGNSMTQARRTYLKFALGKPIKGCDPRRGGSPPVCVAPEVTAFDPYVGDVGSLVNIPSALTAGTYPGMWTITPGVLTINPVTGLITGVLAAGEENYTVTFTNACGNSAELLTTTGEVDMDVPHNLRYANFDFAEFPAAAPTFVAADFTGPSADFYDYVVADPVGDFSMVFPDRVMRQVIWMANSLGVPTIELGGGPVVFDPAANTHVQTLTVVGVPGKVYLTAYRNPGGFTMDVTF